MSARDEWEVRWGGVHPDRLIDPMACRDCGLPQRTHGQQWSLAGGVHCWTMPTQRQIKHRMIRRRKWHGETRWR